VGRNYTQLIPHKIPLVISNVIFIRCIQFGRAKPIMRWVWKATVLVYCKKGGIHFTLVNVLGCRSRYYFQALIILVRCWSNLHWVANTTIRMIVAYVIAHSPDKPLARTKYIPYLQDIRISRNMVFF
jgi:hypothetical protein